MTARTQSRIFFIFTVFLLLHIFFLNINTAEWGDSYRILRASKFVRNYTYPDDEKRPPLYSVLLATYPSSIDPVLWGRILMLFVSIGCFGLFYLIVKKIFNQNDKALLISILLFAFNPVFMYWSIRLMADVFF